MNDHVIAGGTFDRFHKGHELFLETAFKNGKKVFIALTSSEMLKKKKAQNSFWPFEKRKKVVEDFVNKFEKEYTIFPIYDRLRPAIEKPGFDAIVATEETRGTCEEINEIRFNKGFIPLEIIFVPYVRSDDLRVISSTRIRNREIDRDGRVLIDYKLTKKLQREFSKPSNEVFEGRNEIVTRQLIKKFKAEGIKNVICVGDEVSYDFLKCGFKPKNVIIDGKVKRKDIDYKYFILKNYSHSFSVDNEPGMIDKDVWSIMKYAFERESVILVKGEEDLMTYPAALCAEKGSVIVYGQPDVGKVLVRVDEKKKEKLSKKLEEFEIG